MPLGWLWGGNLREHRVSTLHGGKRGKGRRRQAAKTARAQRRRNRG